MKWFFVVIALAASHSAMSAPASESVTSPQVSDLSLADKFGILARFVTAPAPRAMCDHGATNSAELSRHSGEMTDVHSRNAVAASHPNETPATCVLQALAIALAGLALMGLALHQSDEARSVMVKKKRLDRLAAAGE